MTIIEVRITRVIPAGYFPPAIRGVRIPKKFRAPFRGMIVKATLAEDGTGACTIKVQDLLKTQSPYGKLLKWWLKNLLSRDIVGMTIFPSKKFYRKIK